MVKRVVRGEEVVVSNYRPYTKVAKGTDNIATAHLHLCSNANRRMDGVGQWYSQLLTAFPKAAAYRHRIANGNDSSVERLLLKELTHSITSSDNRDTAGDTTPLVRIIVDYCNGLEVLAMCVDIKDLRRAGPPSDDKHSFHPRYPSQRDGEVGCSHHPPSQDGALHVLCRYQAFCSQQGEVDTSLHSEFERPSSSIHVLPSGGTRFGSLLAPLGTE